MDNRLLNLKKMLKPRSIVFIGSKNIIAQGIENCKNIAFEGNVYAVHQRETEINHVRCYKSVDDLPEIPDAAFIAIRNEKSIEVIEQLNRFGVPGAICYAAGFAEIGNQQLHKALIHAAGEMALVGPNCYGVINFLDHVPLWADRFGSSPVKQGVAIISQSGNLSFNITYNDRSLPIAYVFSIGNQAVLDIADYINVLCEDPRVTAIGLHIEGIKNMEKFMKAAKKALEKRIPMVAFKTGVSEAGQELTLSHTSSLAGSDDLYHSLFHRFHITRVYSLSSFLETLKLFSITRTIAGRNLGILTVSGGESAISADEASKNGFFLPKLSETKQKDLRSQLSKFEHISNPLDYNLSVWGNEAKLEKCFKAFIKDDFHCTLLILDYLDKELNDLPAWEAAIQAFINGTKHTNTKPIVISVLPEGLPDFFRKKLISHGITPLQGMTDAFIALKAVVEYSERKKSKNLGLTKLLLPTEKKEQKHDVVLNEWEGKQELKLYGLTIPKGKIINLMEEHWVSSNMKGPFVVKGISSNIAHKTELCAVKLNLHSEEEVKEAVFEMKHRLKDKFNDLRFLVEEMSENYVAELNLGIKRDDQFGLALVISMGGILVNLVNDRVPILLPTTREEILEALYSLKGIKLLTGFRGRPKGDIEAVIRAAESIAAYAEDNCDNLLEMDVNPLLVLPEGKGAVAVDAFIRKSMNI